MRRCLLSPLPDHENAACFLEGAANALLAGNSDEASDLLRKADIPEIMQHVKRLVGPNSVEIHRSIERPKPLPAQERDPDRMPTDATERGVFERDAWRCRFCGMKVLSRKARNILANGFPKISRWKPQGYKSHAALYAMASSLDHVIPHSRGGEDSDENFVTACYGCQFGRGEWLLEEMELMDPRQFAPVLDSWDGLTRIESIKIGSESGDLS